MKIGFKRIISSAAGLLILGSVVMAAPAQAATPEPAPAPAPAPAPNVSEEFLQQNDVQGKVTNIQTDANGAEFYLYDSGDWVLELPSDAAPGNVSAQYEAGICAGTFVDITKLGDELYWGGQESCSSAPADAIYPHSLRMVLRSTCNGFPCGIMTEQREFTSTDSPTTQCKRSTDSKDA